MNNKDAIEWLKAIKITHIHGGDEEYDNLRKEAIDYACNCISFATQVIKIIESNQFPEYAHDEIIDAIKDFRNGGLQ